MGDQGRSDGTALKVSQCAYCGRSFVPNQGVGRPGRYCRRSCRQRAFEMRRHAGDQAWSDALLIVMAERLAAHEDAIDRVRELVDELRADAVDDLRVDLVSVVERLDAAVVLDDG